MRVLFLVAAVLLVTVSTVMAESLPPVEDATAKAECSECHMAYPAITLPQASWKKIFANLSDHFGEDASLDGATTRLVLDYYEKNSNDVITKKYQRIFEKTKREKAKEGKNVKYLRPPGILRTAIKWSSKMTPERLQDVQRFKSKHRFVGRCEGTIKTVMKRARITTLAMCSGCHAAMPINGSSAVRFKFMEKMTQEEKQTALSDEERKCLDD